MAVGFTALFVEDYVCYYNVISKRSIIEVGIDIIS